MEITPQRTTPDWDPCGVNMDCGYGSLKRRLISCGSMEAAFKLRDGDGRPRNGDALS
jgi:hypothetical protein